VKRGAAAISHASWDWAAAQGLAYGYSPLLQPHKNYTIKYYLTIGALLRYGEPLPDFDVRRNPAVVQCNSMQYECKRSHLIISEILLRLVVLLRTHLMLSSRIHTHHFGLIVVYGLCSRCPPDNGEWGCCFMLYSETSQPLDNGSNAMYVVIVGFLARLTNKKRMWVPKCHKIIKPNIV
jgi:hypothetical protein